MAEQSLRDKTVKGVSWNAIDRIANYGIGFLVGIVLARLLSPEEYGLIGIIGIFTAILNIILDSGLSTALIRKDNTTDIDYCTVFYTNIILSVFLTALLYAGAPIIADFFEREELTPYIRVMSSILIINALSLTQQARLTKNINFKAQANISIIAHVGSGIIGIIMAYMDYGVWALVAQQLSSRILSTVCLWIYNKWIPKLIFSWNSFKELFGFSWKLLTAQIVGTIWGQIYQGVIGKYYSPSTLGHYTRARQYSVLASYSLGDVVLKVTLPVMSSIQNEDERLLHAFRKIIKTTMLIIAVIVFGMAASAKQMIFVLIGEQWLPCVPMMQIMAFTFVLYPLHQININMLTVQGRSDILLILQIVKCLFAIVPVLLGIFIGIYWMLIGSAVTGFISLILNAYYSGKKFDYTWVMQVKDILPALGIAFGMAIPVYMLSYLPINQFILFPVQIVLGAMLVYVLCEKTKLEEYVELKGMITNKINSIKRR